MLEITPNYFVNKLGISFDVEINIGIEEFKIFCHQKQLSEISYFQNLFSVNWKPATKVKLELNDIDTEIDGFKLFLLMIYKVTFPIINLEMAITFLDICDKYLSLSDVVKFKQFLTDLFASVDNDKIFGHSFTKFLIKNNIVQITNIKKLVYTSQKKLVFIDVATNTIECVDRKTKSWSHEGEFATMTSFGLVTKFDNLITKYDSQTLKIKNSYKFTTCVHTKIAILDQQIYKYCDLAGKIKVFNNLDFSQNPISTYSIKNIYHILYKRESILTILQWKGWKNIPYRIIKFDIFQNKIIMKSKRFCSFVDISASTLFRNYNPVRFAVCRKNWCDKKLHLLDFHTTELDFIELDFTNYIVQYGIRIGKPKRVTCHNESETLIFYKPNQLNIAIFNNKTKEMRNLILQSNPRIIRFHDQYQIVVLTDTTCQIYRLHDNVKLIKEIYFGDDKPWNDFAII
jgi:hypothetical protein